MKHLGLLRIFKRLRELEERTRESRRKS